MFDELFGDKDLINQFVESLDSRSTIDEDWEKFIREKKIEELEKIIEDENLDRAATYAFIQNAFTDGNVSTHGMAISKIFPPISRFSPGGERGKKRGNVIKKLTDFFEKFFDISGDKL